MSAKSSGSGASYGIFNLFPSSISYCSFSLLFVSSTQRFLVTFISAVKFLPPHNPLLLSTLPHLSHHLPLTITELRPLFSFPITATATVTIIEKNQSALKKVYPSDGQEVLLPGVEKKMKLWRLWVKDQNSKVQATPMELLEPLKETMAP